jgi:hypothetical protein
VRVCTVCNKILNAEFKIDKYFVDEVETQLKEKPLRGGQIQDFHYSKDKASYKVLALWRQSDCCKYFDDNKFYLVALMYLLQV